MSSGRARRRRRRIPSLDAEIRTAARQIYQQGYADAMKAAALMIVAKKLDEVRALLIAAGLTNGASPAMGIPGANASQPIAQPAAPPQIKNPCVICGREGFRRSPPNQFNRVGSWHCRVHAGLAAQTEAEDRTDRLLNQTLPLPPQGAPGPPPQPLPSVAPGAPAPGASSLSAAMGLAELVEE